MHRKAAFSMYDHEGRHKQGDLSPGEGSSSRPTPQDRIILGIFGSPDIRQIDGLGGADSLTSKLALISPQRKPDRISIIRLGLLGLTGLLLTTQPTAAISAPPSVLLRLIKDSSRRKEPFTIVRIFNTNTQKMIHAMVPVEKGEVVSEGDYAIDGVPGTGPGSTSVFLPPEGPQPAVSCQQQCER